MFYHLEVCTSAGINRKKLILYFECSEFYFGTDSIWSLRTNIKLLQKQPLPQKCYFRLECSHFVLFQFVIKLCKIQAKHEDRHFYLLYVRTVLLKSIKPFLSAPKCYLILSTLPHNHACIAGVKIIVCHGFWEDSCCLAYQDFA